MVENKETLAAFDKVYCISLEQCHLRQRNARDQLAKIGVDKFEYFWGTDKDDRLVTEYQDNGLVLTFPPCFRCGKRSCGSETCNNFLIPAQIATFITYLRLWKDIVSSDIGVALVVEDDFVFTEYGPEVFLEALHKDSLDRLGITPESESLVRLGWLRCDEHKPAKNVKLVKGLLRMSNPCHVITMGMAKRLINSFRKIESPVDTYIHDKIGMHVNNYTIYPPVAYDLSWSAGAVESLIHPKPVRAEFLQQFRPHNKKGIIRARRQVETHFMHKLLREVLCVGHPRCGSGYMSQLMKAYGLDVGHEEMGKNGISSWMFSVDDENNPYALNKYALSRRYTVFDHVIHHVRDPKDAIPSIIRENQHSDISYNFRRKHILNIFNIDLEKYTSDIDKAIASFLFWNKIIEQSNPDIVVQVENCEEDISNFLSSHALMNTDAASSVQPDKSFNADKSYQGIHFDKPEITENEWSTVDAELREELTGFCDQFGYDCNIVKPASDKT